MKKRKGKKRRELLRSSDATKKRSYNRRASDSTMNKLAVENNRRMETLVKLVGSSSTGHGSAFEKTNVKPTKITEPDDIEVYFTSFERMILAFNVEERQWIHRLAPQLTGHAQQAYAVMPTSEAADYQLIKGAT